MALLNGGCDDLVVLAAAKAPAQHRHPAPMTVQAGLPQSLRRLMCCSWTAANLKQL